MINTIKNFLGIEPVSDYATLVKQGALILDVRSPGEYAGGHIKGSVNIPVNTLAHKPGQAGDKSRIIITCCASGMRSASARKILKDAGYAQVHNGGGWVNLQQKIK